MTFLAIRAIFAAGIVIAYIGVAVWRRMAAGRGSLPTDGSSKTPSSADSPAPDLSRVRPAASLEKLQKGLANSLPAELRKAAQERTRDLISALTEAHSVLSAGDADALDVAARKIVYCRWITGHGWRSYLASFGPAASVGKQIDEAWTKDARPVVNELARLVAKRSEPTLLSQEGGHAIACSVCGRSAVTFGHEKEGVQAESISKMNPTLHLEGETAQRLNDLLAEGDARAGLDYLTAPGGAGCHAYCAECDRIYCREHYSVEEVWSGSWHEASYATCPLGHEREFE